MKTYGYNTAVRIVYKGRPRPYRIATGMMQYRADTHDVTDTEFPPGPLGPSQPRRDRGVGLGEAELRLTAFLDPSVGLHVAPFNFRIQQVLDKILIYAAGLDFPPDEFQLCLVDEVTKDPVGDPQQPNRVTVHCFCGKFFEAGTK